MQKWGVGILVKGGWISLCFIMLIVTATPSSAVDRVKANNVERLIKDESWVDGVAPTKGDTAVFNSTYGQTGSIGTSGALSWLGLRITTGSGLINIENNTLDNHVGILGGGIDMSAAERDLKITSFQQQADHIWNVRSGRTLTIGTSSTDVGRFSQVFPGGQAGIPVLSLVGEGTISISRATAPIRLGDASSFTGSLNTNGTAIDLTAATNEDFSFAGDLSGTTTISKSGSGVYELQGNYMLGGNIDISAGSLMLSGTGSAGTGDISLASGATLAFNRSAPLTVANDWIGFTDGGIRTLRNDGAGKITLDGGNIGLSSGATTLVLTGSGDGEIKQSIASGGATISIQKDGAGTWALANAETNYSGPTTINAGMLEVTGRLGKGDYAQSIANNSQFKINSTSDQALAGVLSGSGELIKDNSGTLTLSGVNTYTGGTVLADGTLALGSADALGPSGTITFSGGTLQFSESNTIDYSARFATVDNQSFNFHTNDQDITLESDLISTGGSLTKLGGGTLTLTGTNTYTGGTTLASGTLALGSADALGSSGTITFSGGTLQFSESNTIDYSARFATVDNQSFSFDTNAQDITLASDLISTGGSFTKLGAGTLLLTGSSNYTGATEILSGTLQVGDGGTAGNIGIGDVSLKSSATLAFNRSNNISLGNEFAQLSAPGARILRNDGAGILTISDSNKNIGADSNDEIETLVLSGSGNGVIEQSLASGGANLAIRKEGAGTWILTSDSNGYSGETTIVFSRP